jgi:hypothetical protein
MSVYWLTWSGIWLIAAVFIGVAIGQLLKYRHGPKCECGHEADAHEHYRNGSECVECSCQEFHRA